MIIPDVLVLIILVLSFLYKVINYFIYGVSPEVLNSLGGLLIAGGFFYLSLYYQKAVCVEEMLHLYHF